MKLFLLLVTVLLLGGTLSYFGLTWLNSSSTMEEATQELGPVDQAVRLAQSRGCTACHSLDGQKGIGPSFNGGWGASRSFKDGTTVVVDEAYLIESMQAPGLKVVEGYDNVMLPASLTAEEMQSIILLIRELTTSKAE